jgi:drug/metabolite transporter (DMT)-like permease
MGYIAFPWLLALGLRHASASIAALLIALAPVFTGVLTLVLGRIKVNAFWIVGTSLAVVGSTVLLGFDAVEVGRDRLLGNFIVLLAVLAAATGYVSGAEAARETGALAVAIWGHLAAAPPLLIFSGPALDSLMSAGFAPAVWTALAYLAVLSSLGAYIAWYGALARRPAISQIQFLQGAIGVLLAVIFLGEPLGADTVGAAVLILLGVVATQRAVRPANITRALPTKEPGS